MILRHKFIQRWRKQKHLTLTIFPEHLHSQLPPSEASFSHIIVHRVFLSRSYLPPAIFHPDFLDSLYTYTS